MIMTFARADLVMIWFMVSDCNDSSCTLAHSAQCVSLLLNIMQCSASYLQRSYFSLC